MGSLVVSTLPFALGAAISPTVLTIVVLILASGQQALRRSWLFAIGGTAFTAVFIVVCRTLLTQLGDPSGSRNIVGQIIEMVLAVALLVLAIMPFLRHRSDTSTSGRFQRLLGSKRWTVMVAFGAIAMSLNWSTLIIVLAGSHHITQANASASAGAAAAALLLVGAIIPLVIPPLLVTMMGHRSQAWLASLNAFTTRHQRAINAAVLILIAALLVYKALT